MNIDFTGLENFIVAFLKLIAELDLKAVDFSWIAVLQTFFAPVINPIMAAVNEWLYINFGF